MDAMNRTLPLTAAVAVLWLSGAALAQVAPAPPQPDRAAILKAATQVMQQARYCALITLGEDGHPQARAIDAFPPEDGLVVWIATNAQTRKVAQIKRDPRVTLYYFAPADPGYVTLFGKAEVIDSPVEKAKRWKEEWSSFYPDKNKGSDYLLLRVTPFRLEVVSHSHGILNDPKTWVPVSLALP
jgi:general stress protein 26